MIDIEEIQVSYDEVRCPNGTTVRELYSAIKKAYARMDRRRYPVTVIRGMIDGVETFTIKISCHIVGNVVDVEENGKRFILSR